jgi:hypothetical protein
MRYAFLLVALLLAAPSLAQQLPDSNRFGYDPIIYHYGPSKGQLDRINVWPLHAMGLDGSGVKLGILDAGFRWRTATSLMTRRVASEYDYVFHDSVTANQAGDTTDQDGHGTATFSALAGYAPDTLVGPAYNATIYLAKTEDIRSEHHIEEQNYARTLEDMERAGVQITSCSLGYFGFDAPDTSYTRADLNGHTTIAAQAAANAASLGILMVTAMGNNGGDATNPYEETPADADSIISVGALNPDNTLVGFSARGPTSDGRIKPEIAAPGVDVWLQSRGPARFGTFDIGSGTSFATPLVAGACCLIKQAHPEATAQEIRHAVMMTGSQAYAPDTAMGWGRINAYAAALELGTILRQKDAWVDSEAHLCFGIASKFGVQSALLRYHTSTDPTLRSTFLKLTEDSLIYGISLPLRPDETLYYSVMANDGSGAVALLPQSGEASITGIGNVSAWIYPNPAYEKIHLVTNGGADWVLSDAAGRDLLAGSIAFSQPTVDISSATLASGMYYVRVSAPDRGLVVKPVLVIH